MNIFIIKEFKIYYKRQLKPILLLILEFFEIIQNFFSLFIIKVISFVYF